MILRHFNMSVFLHLQTSERSSGLHIQDVQPSGGVCKGHPSMWSRT